MPGCDLFARALAGISSELSDRTRLLDGAARESQPAISVEVYSTELQLSIGEISICICESVAFIITRRVSVSRHLTPPHEHTKTNAAQWSQCSEPTIGA